jgi:predicted O-methyltransferase YrrM
MTAGAISAAFRRESADGIRMARGVRAVSSRQDPAALVLRRALGATLARRAGRVEREQMEQIETLRRELAASSSVIEHVDFGAGEHEPLAAEPYHGGVTVTHTIGDFCRRSSIAPCWSRLLFHLVREAAPTHALEMGTGLGISAAYQGAALRHTGRARLVSIEGSRPLADIARRNLLRLGIDTVDVVSGTFAKVLPAALDRLRPLDYAYLDGHHDGRATLDYFEQLLEFMPGPGILVLDDIAITAGMRAAWAAIARHPRVTLAVDLHRLGVCGVE